MIPQPVITAWRSRANWPLDEQVEQDLILSKVLVDLFNDQYIQSNVAFRGGTALHKVLLPQALRYSEDIDLNRLSAGPAGDLIESVKNVLKKTFKMGPKLKQTKTSIKFINQYDSFSGGVRRVKVEINIKETLPQKPLQSIPFEINSSFFMGSAVLKIFNTEEMIGTKIRALYQRSKGRDLFDLYQVRSLNLNWNEVLKSYKTLGLGISRLEYLNNLNLKMKKPSFTDDIRPLLPPHIEYKVEESYEWFVSEILPLM